MYYQGLKMYDRPPLSEIDQEFVDLTKHFDLEDWRTVRTEEYWWTINPVTYKKEPRGIYSKIEFIRYYVNKGVIKPHSWDDEV